MGISENIIEKNEVYEVEELPKELDPQRTIKRSLLKQATDVKIEGFENMRLTAPTHSVIQNINTETKDADKALPETTKGAQPKQIVDHKDDHNN